MNESKNHYEIEENIIKYRKPESYFFSVLFFLFGIVLMFIVTLGKILNVFIYGKLNFDMYSLYAQFIVSLVFLFISIVLLLGYFMHELIISESFITIRSGFGNRYTISKRCIIAKRTVFASNRGWNSYKVFLYLKNGKKISTGYLVFKDQKFEKIDKALQFKQIINIRALKEELPNLKNVELAYGDFASKRNHIFPMISFFPLILFTIMVCALSFGFNDKCGVQDNFHVSGIVIDKSSYDVGKDNVKYNIVVLDDNTHEKYKIDANQNSYKKCDLNSKIYIEGKKGSLGILYDINFLKGN